MIKYYVYILFSLKDKKLYVGFTSDLKKRFSEHTEGKVIATKNRRPLIPVYYEYFTDVKDAKSRERFLKSGFGRSQLKKELQHSLNKLNYSFLS